jgi:hypothetical protein
MPPTLLDVAVLVVVVLADRPRWREAVLRAAGELLKDWPGWVTVSGFFQYNIWHKQPSSGGGKGRDKEGGLRRRIAAHILHKGGVYEAGVRDEKRTLKMERSIRCCTAPRPKPRAGRSC